MEESEGDPEALPDIIITPPLSVRGAGKRNMRAKPKPGNALAEVVEHRMGAMEGVWVVEMLEYLRQ